MHPTITKGCNIVQSESWDEESSLINDGVVYEYQYQNTKKLNITENYSIPVIEWYSHRVIAEYENYDMNESNHYVTKDGYIEYKENNTKFKVPTNQPYKDAKKLEGKHVIVLKGDNNAKIDNEIVPVGNVVSVLDEDDYIHVQEYGKWPCSMAD